MSAGKTKVLSPGESAYFVACGFGGVLSCGLTHTAVTPIDLIKCNAQANPSLYTKGLFGNARIYVKSEGFGQMGRGWAPTLIGYSLQGMGKFGLYEVFKFQYANIIGKENAKKWNKTLYMAASASAEFFADILLCPFETTKIKVQTEEGYAKGLRDGYARLIREEGFGGAYRILPTLWARQIPYTVIKFVAFEAIINAIYSYTASSLGRPKDSYGKTEQLGFTFLAGYAAGVICGAVSHPADTLCSVIPKLEEGIQSKFGFGQKVKMILNGYSGPEGNVTAIGMGGLWKGFGPRVFMIGTLTGLQWFIYDTWKVTCGIPTTGGGGKK